MDVNIKFSKYIDLKIKIQYQITIHKNSFKSMLTRFYDTQALLSLELGNICLDNHECDGYYVLLYGMVNFGTWFSNLNAMWMGL